MGLIVGCKFFLSVVPVTACSIVCHQIICTKVRDGNKRIVKLKEGKPEGKHVVIVDDLVQSGAYWVE